MNALEFSRALQEREEAQQALVERGDPEAQRVAIRIGDQIRILRASVLPLEEGLKSLIKELGWPASGRIIKLGVLLDAVKLDSQYRPLRRPLKLTIQWDDEYYLVDDNKTKVFATGDTISEALDNYLTEWEDRYTWLAQNVATLGPGLLNESRKMQRLLVEPSADALKAPRP